MSARVLAQRLNALLMSDSLHRRCREISPANALASPPHNEAILQALERQCLRPAPGCSQSILIV
ncbi:MAG: hypothetical protein IPJ18_00120 [Betaproteobacteria bacterium]|nr:hypothetical protein [Betaproteobacteria bacterium]